MLAAAHARCQADLHGRVLGRAVKVALGKLDLSSGDSVSCVQVRQRPLKEQGAKPALFPRIIRGERLAPNFGVRQLRRQVWRDWIGAFSMICGPVSAPVAAAPTDRAAPRDVAWVCDVALSWATEKRSQK